MFEKESNGMSEDERIDFVIALKEKMCLANGRVTDADVYFQGVKDDYNKANEWHYPSKGEYPKSETWVVGVYYGKDNWHKIFYRADGKWWGEGQLCQPPFAWKEIVLPKED